MCYAYCNWKIHPFSVSIEDVKGLAKNHVVSAKSSGKALQVKVSKFIPLIGIVDGLAVYV